MYPMHVLPLLMIPRQHAMRPNTTVTDHTPHCTWEPFCLLSYSGTHSPDVALTRLLDRLWCSARPWMVASGACLPRCFEVRIHPAFFSGLPSPTPPTHPYPCSHFHLLYLCLPGPAAAIGAYYATNRRRGLSLLSFGLGNRGENRVRRGVVAGPAIRIAHGRAT